MGQISLTQLGTKTDDRWALLANWFQDGGASKCRAAACSAGASAVDAEDAVQWMLIELYRSNGLAIDRALERYRDGDSNELDGVALLTARRLAASGAATADGRWRGQRPLPMDPQEETFAIVAGSSPATSTVADERYLTGMLIDAIRNGLSEVRREIFLAHYTGGISFRQLARQHDMPYQQVHRECQRAVQDLGFFVRSTLDGERCGRISETFVLTFSDQDDVDEAALQAMHDHARHCVSCRQIVKEAPGAMREAALVFPLPFLIVASGGGVFAQLHAGAQSIVARASETFAPLSQWPVFQSPAVKPVAAVSAVVLLVAGGGGAYKATRDDGPPRQDKPRAAAPTPARKATPAPRAARKKKVRRKEETPAHTPPPVAQNTPPAATKEPENVQQTDDGGGEFAPDAGQ